jgi:hypothetical protein
MSDDDQGLQLDQLNQQPPLAWTDGTISDAGTI